MEEEDEEKRETGGGGSTFGEDRCAHVARDIISHYVRTYLHSRPSFHMQNHRRRPIVAHCGITRPWSSLPPPHFVYFLAIFSSFFVFSLILFCPASIPYLILPIGDALLHHPLSLPPSSLALLFPRLLFSVASHSFPFNSMQING